MAELSDEDKERAIARLKEYDVNKDGTVTPEEFREVMSEYPYYDDEQIDEMIKGLDKNGDGKLTYDEFF